MRNKFFFGVFVVFVVVFVFFVFFSGVSRAQSVLQQGSVEEQHQISLKATVNAEEISNHSSVVWHDTTAHVMTQVVGAEVAHYVDEVEGGSNHVSHHRHYGNDVVGEEIHVA